MLEFIHNENIQWELLVFRSLKCPSRCQPPVIAVEVIYMTLLLHPFSGLFSPEKLRKPVTKAKTSLDLNEARDYGVLGCSGISWTICKNICTLL